MKKLVSIIAVLVLLCCCALAEEVYVTISDDKGEIVVAGECFSVSDADGDGVVSMSDALYAAHADKYPGGAEAGFMAEKTEFGLSMNRLWGVENGGSYGYFLNDATPNSLLDAVKDGDRVYAYVFTDLDSWSDTYSFFDITAIETGDAFELTLMAQSYDADWNAVYMPVAGAKITVNGVESGIVTDASGKAVIDIAEPGRYLISADSDEMTLVPPLCIADII